MTKSELITLVTERSPGLSRKDTEVIVDTIMESMTAALAAGEKIELRGFGSFKVKERTARVGRNPRTGVKVNISHKRTLLFKPAKELRILVDRGKPLQEGSST